uniref:hypothetical protein n=1 Tax=Lactobacillus acidophilus TaxID=1579 RepID=UPI003F5490E1
MFNKSDSEIKKYINEQYQLLSQQLDEIQAQIKAGQRIRAYSQEKIMDKYLKRFAGFVATDKTSHEDLGWIEDQDKKLNDNIKVLDQLHSVYSLIFKNDNDESDDITGGFSNQKYYRVDIDIEDATESEINAILLKHILNYENNPSLTYNRISTTYFYKTNVYDYSINGAVEGERMAIANEFFYDGSVSNYGRTTFTNNDKLISYIKVDNLYNKSREMMKNLTQFEVKND